MTSKSKLFQKLIDGTIKTYQLRTLLYQNGWVLDRTRGSHEIWTNGNKTFVLATHSKELKPYQIKEAQTLLDSTENENAQKVT